MLNYCSIDKIGEIEYMAIYFVFTDEYGSYQCKKTEKYLRCHPYYIRTALIINADEWKTLNFEFHKLKNNYKLPKDKEIKWAYLWSIKSFQENLKTIPEDKEFKFLEKYEYSKLTSFVDESLGLLHKLNYCTIICTITDNKSVNKINANSLLKMHLQEIVQRVEMEIQSKEDNLGVIFMDPISEDKNNYLRDNYYDLFIKGDYIRYKHIKDTINLENSHQSVGIQIADYISGAFCSFIKSFSGKNNFNAGKRMFKSHIYPYLRRHRRGEIFGFGIREVPSSTSFRKALETNFKAEMEKTS